MERFTMLDTALIRPSSFLRTTRLSAEYRFLISERLIKLSFYLTIFNLVRYMVKVCLD